MMAGTGVSVGGGGMLRTRRRDVSVKPNRKLDRKSSRGMIYENEELRLRTIHINAEVEQGHNDIKKLRRENEQLRREIWSLRDEYDKLEEILKRQKSQDESEEYEDRSEEDDGLRSDYSCEEDDELDEKEAEDDVSDDGGDREERLENAENQKISSEKTNSSQHRLHVDFDDLSVVDEEEELKKEKREAPSDGGQPVKEDNRNAAQTAGPRQLHENIPFYPANYDQPGGFTGTSYYSDCPFDFPSGIGAMMSPDTPTVLASPCSRLYADPLIPMSGLDTSSPGRVADPTLPQIHLPPVGWQNNLVTHDGQLPGYSAAPPVATSSGVAMLSPLGSTVYQEGQADRQAFDALLLGAPSYSSPPNLLQRRTLAAKQPAKTRLDGSTSRVATARNGWNAITGFAGWGESSSRENNASNEAGVRDLSKGSDERTAEASGFSTSERPKHFFAPLPSKARRQNGEESPTASTIHFGTGTSSSSGRTGSTVVCRGNDLAGRKGSADVYVNGAVPCERDALAERDCGKTFLSTDNLLVDDARCGASNQLTKSVSCQDLCSEPQNGGPRTLAKSDNALDSINSGAPDRPYKTRLDVTLRMPRLTETPSPATPEVPKLPAIDYRLFNNPFLRRFELTRPVLAGRQTPPLARPLSIEVNEAATCQYRVPPICGYAAKALDEPYQRDARSPPDHGRLLIPTEQLANGKVKQDVQVTSFERPSPHALLPSAIPYDLDALRRFATSRCAHGANLYQSVPFVARGAATSHAFAPLGPVAPFHEGLTSAKVPAQTQTSMDGDESSHPDGENASEPSSPCDQRRRRMVRRERQGAATRDQKQPLSPGAQRRLRKQSSVTSAEAPDSPGDKHCRQRARKLSAATTATASDAQEEKNESRSSSSGQDSPRKDQSRRVSVYFNAKQRPSLASVKTTRSGGSDVGRDKYGERERTNSVSSREMASGKSRKTSTSSGSVPWCACWGNGCV